jgi:hypothetical protein
MLWSHETPAFKFFSYLDQHIATHNKIVVGKQARTRSCSLKHQSFFRLQNVGRIYKIWHHMVHSLIQLPPRTSLVFCTQIFGGHKTFNSMGGDSHTHMLRNFSEWTIDCGQCLGQGITSKNTREGWIAR